MLCSFRDAAGKARRDPSLSFAALLSAESILEALGDARLLWQGWIYTPATTVWVFLSQCLSMDHSCRDAVARLIAWRVARGQRPCSADTGAYCTARDALPEEACRRLVCQTGSTLEREAPSEWLWHSPAGARGRRFHDHHAGHARQPSRLSADDVSAEARLRLSHRADRRRLFVVRRYRGGGGHRELQGKTDRREQPVPHALRLPGRRRRPLGRSLFQRLVRPRPASRTQRGYGGSQASAPLDGLPNRPASGKGRPPGPLEQTSSGCLDVAGELCGFAGRAASREVRVRVAQKGFRTKELVVVTTLLDPVEYPAEEIGELYRRRWHAELNLRNLKTVLQMDHLRCKTPHRVRNEFLMHLVAYNLIRRTMAMAAKESETSPLLVSFKGALQTVNAFLPLLSGTASVDTWCQQFVEAIATHVVGHRPDRFEPRVKKRRAKEYDLMVKPAPTTNSKWQNELEKFKCHSGRESFK